jgi:hypothetical protein
VESFGDAVVAGEAPHTGDFRFPGMKGFAERGERGEGAGTQLPDEMQKQGRQLPAFVLIEAFVQQQGAEALFEPVDRLDGGVPFQILVQARFLFRRQVGFMTPHQREQPAIPGSVRIELLPQNQTVMSDQANDNRFCAGNVAGKADRDTDGYGFSGAPDDRRGGNVAENPAGRGLRRRSAARSSTISSSRIKFFRCCYLAISVAIQGINSHRGKTSA